ncbi:hypothetical protein P7C70_g4321, partial [Phenoliferia sp. Uapishka_3]
MPLSDSPEHRCQWLDCTNSFPDAEALYDHITSTHIGRKSAGTLSLECHWAGCSSKATKRDHLTSHARVHINLKPHSCGICQKSFKRPQDLKKHEKIHTEEHHAHHKHSKAVTAATSGAQATPPPHDDPKAVAAMQSAVYPPFPVPPYGYPYGFPQMSGAPMFPGFPSAPSPQDVGAYLEQQRQLNALAVANPNFGLGVGGANPYGLQYPPYANMPGMQGMQGMPMYNPAMMQGFPGYGFFPHPGVQHNMMSQGGATIPLTAHSYPLNGGAHQLPTPPNSNASFQGPPPMASSLYPSLPTLGSLYPAVKAEDASSPAQSTHSHDSSRHSHSHSSTSGHSPNPPSLSPASYNQSPSPEHESDVHLRRMFSGNAVAGHKRGFEDAADGFLQNLKNKRFQEEDLTQQVDSLDALALLLNPGDFSTNTPPPRSVDSSGSSSVSEYHPADVENINDLLANLAQSIDEVDHQKVDSYHQSAHPQSHQQHSMYSNPPVMPTSYGSMYPSLHAFEQPRVMAQMPRTTYGSQLPPTHSMYPDMHHQPSIRMNKAPMAPTISSDPSRINTYRHMEHLNRSSESKSRYRGSSIRTSSMDVDEEDEELVNSRKGYSSSIRSTSLDTTTSSTSDKSASTLSSNLSPIIASSFSEEPIESSPSSTPSIGGEGPRLPPMVAALSTTVPTTLPPLRDVLEMARYPSSTPSSSSSFSDTPTTSSSTASNPLYPSLSSLARPASSGSGVERLVPRFTLLGVRSDSEAISEGHEDYGRDADDSGIEDDDEVDHRSKKTRVASPAPMDENDAKLAAAVGRAKRLQVISALIAYVNAQFRANLVKQRLAAVSAATPTPAPTKIAPEPIAA